MGEFTLLPGSTLPLSWFACTPESPSRILERVWLAFSPFAPGLTRAIGSSNPGPRGSCRQAPRTSSPVLGRHLNGLPHHALLRQKVRPTLLSYRSSSRHSSTLQHVQTKRPLFSLGFWPSIRSTKPCRPKVPTSGFGYPPAGVSLFALGSLFQLPTLLGFSLQGFFLIPGRVLRFPKKPSAPALPHQTLRPGTGASAAFASRSQWFPRALSLSFK
jgi:hypothetical protein